MRIAILSRRPELYSTRRLVAAAAARGHDVRVMDTLRFDISLRQNRPELYYEAAPVEGKGADVRVFGVGDEVVAAMRRKAGKGEFRSNLHRGGKARQVKLNKLQKKTALTAAQVLGLRVAGVDMIESKHGPMVMEVNS